MKRTMHRPRRLALPVFCLLVLTLACGQDEGPTGPGDPSPAEVLPPDPDGMALPGEPDHGAADNIVTLLPSPAPVEEIDGPLLTTRLAAVIAPEASVGEVNAALDSQGAAIVSMRAGDPFVTLVIDAVGDIAEARALADALEASGAFVHARPGFTSASGEIVRMSGSDPPAGSSSDHAPDVSSSRDYPEEGALAWVEHLMPSRLPAAWNVRDRARGEAVLIVPSTYADVSDPELPGLHFAESGSRPVHPDDGIMYGAGNLGFYLAGIAAADWSFESGAHPHTGADPVATERLDLIGVHTYGLDWSEQLAAIAESIPSTGNRVLLTWQTFNDPAATLYTLAERCWLALQWRRLVQATVSGGPAFVHVAACGERREGDGLYHHAEFNSPFALATSDVLHDVITVDAEPDEVEAFQAAYRAAVEEAPAIDAPLANVLLVGSSSPDGVESDFSSHGSEVRVVGGSVPGACLVWPECENGSLRESGAHAAAAQVAGLACYLWHLDEDASRDDILLRLQHAYSSSALPGILDAWTAVLSMEGTLGPDGLRATLLDVSGPDAAPDGRFDEDDLEEFLSAFEAFAGASERDWSVYDLNGDGWTGGDRTARMDLDVNDPPGFTTVEQTIGDETVSYDETAVTDLEVLCYYAHSPLYAGSPGIRDELLDGLCGGGTAAGLFVEILGLPERITVPSTFDAQVRVETRGGDGTVDVVAGASVSLSIRGGDADPDDGFTDEQGIFTTHVTIFEEDYNEIEFRATAGSGSVYAQTTETVLRQNEIRLISHWASVAVGLTGIYTEDFGIPGVYFLNDTSSFSETSFAPVDTAFALDNSGSGAGITVRGTATAHGASLIDLEGDDQLRGYHVTAEQSASVTLIDPNFDLLSYQGHAHAIGDFEIEFMVFGDPAHFSLNGTVGGANHDYKVELNGDEDVFYCDTFDPCNPLSAEGMLAPDRYRLKVKLNGRPQFHWYDGCTDCDPTSGTLNSEGNLSLDFVVSHGE